MAAIATSIMMQAKTNVLHGSPNDKIITFIIPTAMCSNERYKWKIKYFAISLLGSENNLLSHLEGMA